MNHRNRNLGLALIALGVFIFMSRWVSFLTIAALVLIFLGLRKIRDNETKQGNSLLMIGIIFLLIDHFTLILGLIFLSLGLYYVKSKRVYRDDRYFQKQSFLANLKWNREPWILQNMSLWHVIGEANLDLSLAIPEEEESIIILQGGYGDVHITVPDDIGVEIEMTVVLGRLRVEGDIESVSESGIMKTKRWKSPNYSFSDQKVKLLISYIVGEIEVRVR